MNNRPRKPILPYHTPQLQEFGDLRTLTLGVSIGAGDSQGGLLAPIIVPDGSNPADPFNPITP